MTSTQLVGEQSGLAYAQTAAPWHGPAAAELTFGELLLRHRAGDPEAAQELFTRTRPRLELFVRARIGRTLAAHVDAEDIVQDALADALVGLPRFEPRCEQSFEAWLARIAERRLRTALRRGRAQRREWRREISLDQPPPRGQETPEPIDPGGDPSVSASERELAMTVRCAVWAQPPALRLALHLRLFEPCPWPEVARLIGSPSPAAARQLTARALERLARHLRGRYPLGS